MNNELDEDGVLVDWGSFISVVIVPALLCLSQAMHEEPVPESVHPFDTDD